MAVPVQVDLDPNTRKVEAALARIKAQAKGVNFGGGAESINKLSRPLGKITGQASEFQKSLEASNARVLAFGASVAVINKLSQAFGALVTNTIKVEASFAKINTILGGTQKQLEQFGNGIFKVAQQTGTSFDQVAEGALELARQGLSVEESLSRVSTALKLVRVSGIDAEKAVGGLTAAIKGFEGAGLTVAQIADKLAEVDTKFAVSTEDLINGLERASASARVAGVSFDELLGVITTVQERTQRGGAVIGNAFKTIFARLGRSDTLIALQDLGISVLDTEGNVRGAIPLFEELAAELNKIGLKSVEAGNIIQKVAGVRQRDILISLVEDLNSEQSQFTKTLQASAGATDTLDAKNSQLNQTLEALINNLTVGSQKLASVLGDLGFTDAAGDILKAISSIVNGITDILQGEGIGAKFAQGLVKGVGDILTGPGLALISAIFLKLFVDLSKFGASSLKSLLGINQAAQQQNALQQSVLQTLLQNEDIQREILKLEGNKVAQEQLLLRIYNEQAAALARVQKAAATVTPGLFGAGLRGGERGVTPKGKASGGYIAAEARDVSRGVGGAPASSKVVSIPNFAFGGGKRGTMVANTSEYIVPNFAGGGDAIFNRDMVRSMGLPAGARKINAASGYIPNFAAPSLSNLTIAQIGRLKAGNTVKIDGKTLKAEDFGTTSEALKASGGLAPSLVQRKKSRKTTAKDYPFSAKGIIGVLSAFQGSTSKRATKRFGAMSPSEQDNFKKILKDQNINPKSSITIDDIQNRSIEKINKNKLSTFRKDIDTDFAEPLINFASKLIRGAGIQGNDLSEFNNIVKTSKGNLFSTSVEGGIFESAIQLGTRNLEQIRSFLSTTGDEQTPFDFEEGVGSEVSENFKQTFGFGSQLKKADAKRTVNSKPLSTLIGKSLRDSEIRGLIFGASSGYIPNFAQSPLEDAISREQAAGLPISQIRINQSGKLRNAQNPMGLAVTNTRDEPTGRIPNFSTQYPIGTGTRFAPGGGRERDGVESMSQSAGKASAALDNSIGKIFALQLATSALTNTFTEQDSVMGKFGEGLSSAINTLFVLSATGASPLGVFGKGGGGLKSIGGLLKGAKSAAGALNLIKGLAGPVALGLTALSTALKIFTGKSLFQIVGEGLGLVATESQKAAKKINAAAESLQPGKEGVAVGRNVKNIRDQIFEQIRVESKKQSLGIKGEASPEDLRLSGILASNSNLKENLPQIFGGKFRQAGRLKIQETLPAFDPAKGKFGTKSFNKKDTEIITKRLQSSLFANAGEILDFIESETGKKIDSSQAKELLDKQRSSVATFFESVNRGEDVLISLDSLSVALNTNLVGLISKYKEDIEEAFKKDPSLRISTLNRNIDRLSEAGKFAKYEDFQIANVVGGSRKGVISPKDSQISQQLELQIKLSGQLGDLERERLSAKKAILDFEIETAEKSRERGVSLAKRISQLTKEKGVNAEVEKQLEGIIEKGGSYEEVQASINQLIEKSGKQLSSVSDEMATILKTSERQNKEAIIYNNTQEEILNKQEKIAKLSPLQKANITRRNDLKELEEQVPKRLADNLESSIGNALDNVAMGTYDSLGDVFLNIALDFGRALQQEISRAAAKSLVQSFTSSGAGSGIFKGIGNFFSGFNSGGLVSGGSGVRDDIPAKLTGGEYVIRKSAVQKYGVDFLESLNSEKIKGMQNGGTLTTQGADNLRTGRFWSDPSGYMAGGTKSRAYLEEAKKRDFFVPGQRGFGEIVGKENLLAFSQQKFTTGATDVISSRSGGASINLEDQSLRLTAFGRRRESPAKRALEEAQAQAFDLYNQSVAEERRVVEENKQAKKARSSALKQAIIGSVANATMAGFGALASSGSSGSTSTFPTDIAGNATVTPSTSLNSPTMYNAAGGITTNSMRGTPLAGSGNVFSQYYSNISSMPRPIQNPYSFGEFFAGRQTSFFNRYANGGLMSGGGSNALLMDGEYVMGSEASSSLGRDTLDSINLMNFSNGGSVGGSTSSITGGKNADVGTLNIEINITNDGKASTSASGSGEEDPEKAKAFSRKIKEVVLNVINEEKRVSGSLFTRNK